MSFFTAFVRNLALLAVLGLVLYMFFPDTMAAIAQLAGGLFGPGLILLMLIVAALPSARRRR